MARSNLVAVGMNVVAGALALRRVGERTTDGDADGRPAGQDEAGARSPAEAARTVPAVLAVAALSGLGALAHEVAWTRTLTLLIGPTAYSFAFILAAVIGGIALGSAAAAPFADRVARPLAVLAGLQALTAAASLAVTHAVSTLPVPVGELVRANADRVARLLALELVGVVAVVVLPCLLFGATFPFAVAAVARHGRPPGRALGEVYAWNTAGAVAGSLLAGFLALPLLGLRGTLLAAAATHALAGVVAGTSARLPAVAAAAALLGLGGPALLPAWDTELMAGGVYRYATALDAGALEEELRGGWDGRCRWPPTARWRRAAPATC
jgi:spermidine synthase